MFLIKKAIHSNARLFSDDSKFFSFKKNNKFKFFIKTAAGRNNNGCITVRHKKKTNKSLTLSVNFTRNFVYNNLVVTELVFWKKKKPYLMLVKNKYNTMSYFISPISVFLGKKIRNFALNFLNIRRRLCNIKFREVGNFVCFFLLKTNDLVINLISAKGLFLKIACAAGTCLKVLYKTFCKNYVLLVLPSGIKKKLSILCYAVLGRNSNQNLNKHKLGFAGVNFRLGVRPSVRGVAMNPVDHPNGGRTKTNKPEKTPWGWVAKKKK